MNYQNVEKEIKQYLEYFKLSQNTIIKLSNYYKEVAKQGKIFVSKIKQCLEDFYFTILKEERTTTYNKLLVQLYDEKKDFLEKIRLFFENIEKNFGGKLAEYEKDYRNKMKNLISEYNLIYDYLSKGKIKLDKWKNQYLDYCNNSIELEKKIKSFQDLEEKRDTINKLKTQLVQNEELKELKRKNYKEEQINLNKQLIFYETNYYDIIRAIENEDVEKMQYVISTCKDYNQNLALFLKNSNESLDKIDNLQKKLNAKNDWKTLRKLLSFNVEEDINKEKRFILEDFLDYDTIKKEEEDKNNDLNNINNKDDINNQNINIINNNEIKQNNNNNTNIILITNEKEEKLNRIRKILKMGKTFFIDLKQLNEEEQEINKIIIDLITSENKIDNSDLLKIINFVENSGKNCKIFVDILATHFCKDQFIIIKNYDNFYNIINISVFILNYIFDQKNFFDICFLIIFIAEKSANFGPNLQSKSPIFLFEIISKKTIFSSLTFWKDLIDTKIDMVSQLDINKEYKKRMKNSLNNNTKYGNKNSDLESELMLKQIFREKVGIYFTDVFYGFLKHFTHFDFYKQEEILNYYNNKYNLDETSIEYFKLLIKSDNIFNEQKNLDVNKKPRNKILFEYKPKKTFKKIENDKIKCLLFSLKYLDSKEITSIICLNKLYYKPILFTIYKQFLLKKEKIDVKTHLMIWKILLNYREIKKEFNYKEIFESIKDNKKEIANEQIIQMDIGRTYFSQNKEENKTKLSNILKSISNSFPEIVYCQGMNQIGAFLLHICDYNEEEAFYLFLAILKNTDYYSIFENNLEKINYFFYQFDHLLNLYLPGIYIYFNKNNINATFFISSWIITLCTNFFDDSEENNNKESIMLVWDLFFFYGWKIFAKVGLILLKQREKEIFENYSEGLLPLLTGDLIKTEIIGGKHFEKFKEELIDHKFDINQELFDNIGNEYSVKKKIEFFHEGNKIDCAF